MKLKDVIILTLFLFTCHFTNAQKSISNKRVGITFSSVGINKPIRFTDLDGAPDFSSKWSYSFGINYIHPLNNWLEIETGIEYAEHTIKVRSNLPPFEDRTHYNTNLSLINIPMTVRANFWDYLFVNGGMLLDFETSSSSNIDTQSGIGAILGIGAQYEFNNGFGLFINPYAKAHTLIPFSSEKYHQRLMEAGVR
ncbi:MAG: outer membrane beta-barrel protein, partial [Dysgonamonadaceae bacterium]